MMSAQVLSPMRHRDMSTSFRRDHFYALVGERICAVREEAKLSKGELARRLGATLGTVQNAEAGHSCSLHLIVRIAEVLDVSVDELIPLEAT